MTCPVCGEPLGDSQMRCSGCGYSFREPLNIEAEVTPPDVRPKAVVLATRLLALHLTLDAVFLCYVYFQPASRPLYDNQGRQVGTYSTYAGPAWLLMALVAAGALFVALIWWGVRWARIVFLIKVAIVAAFMIWGFMAALTLNQVFGYLGGMYGSPSVGGVIDFLVAYLLLQPESRIWFYGRYGAM